MYVCDGRLQALCRVHSDRREVVQIQPDKIHWRQTQSTMAKERETVHKCRRGSNISDRHFAQLHLGW